MDDKPKRLDRLLVADCSIGHKPSLLHVSRWDMDQSQSTRWPFFCLKDGLSPFR